MCNCENCKFYLAYEGTLFEVARYGTPPDEILKLADEEALCLVRLGHDIVLKAGCNGNVEEVARRHFELEPEPFGHYEVWDISSKVFSDYLKKEEWGYIYDEE